MPPALNLASKGLSFPKVAMLTSGDLFGGAERQLLLLCAAGACFFEATIFPTLNGPLEREARAQNLSVNSTLAAKKVRDCAQALVRIITTEGFSVIHAHGYRSETIVAVAMGLYGLDHNFPVVRTVHGAPEIIKAPKAALYSMIGNLASTYTRAYRVYVSHELAQSLGATHARRARIIHNGTTITAACGPRPQEYLEGVFNIVSVGRLTAVKGLAYLLQAMPFIQASRPVHLHLVGDGPDRQALEKQAVKLGIGPFVHFHGFRGNALDYIGHADALILPSLHEGIPYVLLEAMFFKVPVVASDVGGIPEVVRNNHDGLLVPSKDPEALAQSITNLLATSILRRTLGANARVRVEEAFSSSAMAEDYAELYREILSS